MNDDINFRLPSFYLPLSFGAVLPGRNYYFKFKSIKETNKVALSKPKSREDLIFNNLHSEDRCCFLKFTFNTFGIIEEITYYGKLEVNYSSIYSLVGLHETYLNNLLERTEVRLVDDIPTFLSENWSMALFHDNFSKLILKLKSVILDKENILEIQNLLQMISSNNQILDRNYVNTIVNSTSLDLKKKIEVEILYFLKENRNHLHLYHIPQEILG